MPLYNSSLDVGGDTGFGTGVGTGASVGDRVSVGLDVGVSTAGWVQPATNNTTIKIHNNDLLTMSYSLKATAVLSDAAYLHSMLPLGFFQLLSVDIQQ